MLDLLTIASHEYNVCSDLSNLAKNELTILEGKQCVIIFNQNKIESLLSARCMRILIQNGITETEELIKGSQLTFKVLSVSDPFESIENLNCEAVILMNEQNYPAGIINNVSSIVDIVRYLDFQESEVRKTLLEYEAIFESLEEEIFVTNQHGIILRLNAASERVFGLKKLDLIGKHVSELVKRNIISSSTTEAVLEQKCRVNMMQDMMISGKKVIGTAIPIFDEVGQLVRVVSTSKDIDQINRLKSELDKKNTELGLRDKELDLLRSEMFSQVNFVYASKVMDSIKDRILRIADTDLSVLIHGESGVGKEVIAKVVHNASKRKEKPFVKINCGLIPENLLESELFGYERGAFTGADKKGKIGKVELANGGTLFLDEIGEVPLALQVKLLEFLQDRTICRVGGTRTISIDTRVLAATNCDLQDLVTKKLFRQDLYYRLNIMPIKVPPLRERKDDIDILVEFFRQKINKKYGMSKRISPELKKALNDFDWPGNVRELEHVVERLMVISDSNLVSLENIEDQFEIKSKDLKTSVPKIIPLKAAKAKVEEELVRVAYAKCHSTYKAAEMLEVDQSTIVKLLKKYNVKDRATSNTTESNGGS